jgi:tRNA 2-selenouridine synthase SelU
MKAQKEKEMAKKTEEEKQSMMNRVGCGEKKRRQRTTQRLLSELTQTELNR